MEFDKKYKEIVKKIVDNEKMTNEQKNEKIKEETTALLEPITRNNIFGRDYLQNFVFSTEKQDLELSDLGNFEYQFERILAKLPENNKFPIYEEIKKQGWCVNWFQELFEDAYSVLALGPEGPEFLKLFKTYLVVTVREMIVIRH